MKLYGPTSGRVNRLTHDGSGEITRAEGKPIMVYNVLPGETVKVTPFKRTKEGVRAKLDSVEMPSKDRVTPRCPYAGTCGGCKWQHASYEAQLKAKWEMFCYDFTAAGIPCPVSAVEGCPDPFYYRNRMDYVFGHKGELGLKQPDRWWATLDLETCFLLSEDGVEIMKRVREWSKASGLPFWDSKSHVGFFRYLVIREGKRTGERMVMMVTAPNDDAREKMAELPVLLNGLATSVVWGINPTVTDLSVAHEIRPLFGNPFIHEEVGGIRYKITPNAFFQTNSVMAQRLQETVLRHCEEAAGRRSNLTVLDLYCGSGFFSLALAKRIPQARIVGIELDAEAIAAANENVSTNFGEVASVASLPRNDGLPEYFVSKAEAFDWEGYEPDAVILDPPRAGLHPSVIETVLRVKPPLVVYVSCNYRRFLQEWKELSKEYTLDSAAALDLFPHTPHMECVFRLVRK